MSGMKEKAIEVLENSENPKDAIETLCDLGFHHTYRCFDAYKQVWEHPDIKGQDTSGARILSAHFYTLYESTATGTLAFVIGRLGNTATYMYTPPRSQP